MSEELPERGTATEGEARNQPVSLSLFFLLLPLLETDHVA